MSYYSVVDGYGDEVTTGVQDYGRAVSIARDFSKKWARRDRARATVAIVEHSFGIAEEVAVVGPQTRRRR